MRSTWLLRVLYRRRGVAALAFLSALGLGLAVALLLPLQYESQLMLERRPARLSPQLSTQERSTEFELSRLTSETQRTVALLKSRAMMEAWAKAIGVDLSRDREDALDRLAASVAVQPVNYTDVFTLKVRAGKPEEASRRASALADTFIKWDATQNARQSENLTGLLNEHRAEVRRSMEQNLARLRKLKNEGVATLSGSPAQKKLESDVESQQKLLENLSAEIEAASRQSEGLARTNVLTPAIASTDPVMSRARRVALAVCFAILFAFFAVFLAEWQDPAIHRAQEIARWIPAAPVLSIPRAIGKKTDMPPAYLAPLADNIAGIARLKGTAVVQVTSVGDGDGGRAAVCSSLTQLLSPAFNVAVRSKMGGPVPATIALPHGPKAAPATPTTRAETRDDAPDVVILDLDNVPGSLPASNLMQRADITCVVLSAGKTSKHLLRPLRQQLDRFPHQKCVLVLDRYEDPLPAGLRS